MKVKILKPVGQYLPGQEIELDDQTAKAVCDGVKAMSLDDFQKLDAAKKDPKNLTVLEMNQLGVKNIAVEHPDHAVYAQTEAAALAGKPVLSGEALTTTGGVTPPSLVFPAMAKAGGHDFTDVKELKGLKVDKKDDAQKAKK